MVQLSTTYMGLSLRNPLIVASSHLTASKKSVVACEEAGAAAVVLKSLFEEQIELESRSELDGASDMGYADGYDFLQNTSKGHSLDRYLSLIEECKKVSSIPIIASVNCVSPGNWIKYAEKFERVGADGLELNCYPIPADIRRNASFYEKQYLDIARKIKKQLSIPVAMKIAPAFTDMAHMIDELASTGLDGLVLFNRLYRPDVDLDKLTLRNSPVVSAPQEMYQTLQWIALLSGEIEIDFCAATGVHDSEGVLKQLLVGARAVQLCSAIINGGLGVISRMLEEVREWLESRKYDSVEAAVGVLNQESSDHPERYERSQYVKGVVGGG